MWPLMCPLQRNLLLLRSQMTYLKPRHSHAIIPLEYEENISSALLFFHMMHPPFSFWVHPCFPTVESGSPLDDPTQQYPLIHVTESDFSRGVPPKYISTFFKPARCHRSALQVPKCRRSPNELIIPWPFSGMSCLRDSHHHSAGRVSEILLPHGLSNLPPSAGHSLSMLTISA